MWRIDLAIKRVMWSCGEGMQKKATRGTNCSRD